MSGSLLQLAVDERLPRVGEVLGGKYRVERMIARGGMGAVFVAVHAVTGGRVALKWLLADDGNDAEASHRLIREARAAARVRHPNVVSVYDIGEHAGSLFLVMELLEGETLSSLLKRKGALDVQEALDILLPTMRAVHAAHRSHVIHRDLKPSNVFLCADESGGRVPRVLDFGISKLVATPDDPEYSLTQTGAVMGTPYYMAPEQLSGRDIDHRIDVYALGVILYQALGGQLPFSDTNYNALVVLIATATPAPLSTLRPDLPRALCAVVEKAMARQRDDRYASVAELMEALQLAVQPASQDPSAVPTRKPARTQPKLLAAVALACAAVGLIAWWVLAPRPPDVAPIVANPAPAASVVTIAAPPTPEPEPIPTPTAPEPLVMQAPPTAAAPSTETLAPSKPRAPRKQKRSAPARAAATDAPAGPVSISADQF